MFESSRHHPATLLSPGAPYHDSLRKVLISVSRRRLCSNICCAVLHSVNTFALCQKKMPIKYIGRTTDFSGKPLWEILGNLKGLGVGRLVMRNMHKRYSEPCFFRILQVQPLPRKEGEERRVRAIVEKVFRGQRYPAAMEMETQSYKADFRLVPKHEESALWKAVEAVKMTERVLPSTIEYPPLLKYMIQEEMKASGGPVVEPKLKIVLNLTGVKSYRLATEGETPNTSFSETRHPHLYNVPKEKQK